MLTFSVVCLFNPFFTVNQSLTSLGTKLMTVMKCLTSKDGETQQIKIMMSSLEQSVRACLSLRIIPRMWSKASPFTSHWQWCGGCGEGGLWGWGRIYNCMAVWPSLNILFPCRIPVIVIRWLSLQNVSVFQWLLEYVFFFERSDLATIICLCLFCCV